MKHNIFALVFCLLSFTAFAQDAKQKDPYLGLDKKAVIERFGQPTVTKKASGDSETLIYIIKQASKEATNDKQKTHMYTFTLDKNGKVTEWKES